MITLQLYSPLRTTSNSDMHLTLIRGKMFGLAARSLPIQLVARIVETTYFALLLGAIEMPMIERHAHKVGNSARLHLLHDRGPVMLGRPRADP